MSGDIFSKAHKFTAKWEGGFSDNPKDPGGATNHGVSLRWLKALAHDVNGDGVVDRRDIIDLKAAQAAALFHEHFWVGQKLDELPALVAVCQYDASVNMGLFQAARVLQRACNSHPGSPLVVDGRLGARTRERVRGLCGGQTGCGTGGSIGDLTGGGASGSVGGIQARVAELSLVDKMIAQRESFYRALARDKPSLSVFLSGWLNRSTALRQYLRQFKEAA